MSILVLGLARSGQAAALALRRRGKEVIGVDASAELDTGRLAESGVELHLGTEEERLLDGVETLIKSPGVPAEALLVAAARSGGIAVWSELELGARLLPNPILGVTGTNGKTTTSELLGVMLGAPVAGNVGRALCDLDGFGPRCLNASGDFPGSRFLAEQLCTFPTHGRLEIGDLARLESWIRTVG